MTRFVPTALELLALTLAVAANEPSAQEVDKLLADLSDCLRKPSAENMKRQPRIEAKLVALGEQALPVLERELQHRSGRRSRASPRDAQAGCRDVG